MAIKKTVLGRIPTLAGAWDANYTNPSTGHSGYPLKKRVTHLGSEFQSLVEDNTYAPATLNQAGTQITFDTTHWMVISNGSDAYLLASQTEAALAELENVAFIDDSESSPAVIPDFDPVTDTVHVTAQTLSEQQKAQVRTNIGLGDVDIRISNAVTSEASQRAAAVSAEQSRAQGVEATKADKSDTYTKAEVNNIASAFTSQKYVTVEATAQTTSATDVLPSSGQATDTVYRIAKWDGSAYNTAYYSEYTWNGSAYIFMDVKNTGIDDDIIVGSNNLAKNSAIAEEMYFTEYIKSIFVLHWTHIGDGTYGEYVTRNATLSTLHFDFDVYISIASGKKYALQYFDGYEIGQDHMTYASPWFYSQQKIPAGTYWRAIVANSDDSETTQETTEALSFSSKANAKTLLKAVKVSTGKLLYMGYISIDNETKTISLPGFANLIFKPSEWGSYYMLGAGYSLSYASIVASTSLWFLIYNIDSNNLELHSMYSSYNTEYPLICKLVIETNTRTVIRVYDCVVSVMLDGSLFSIEAKNEIKTIAEGVINNKILPKVYDGEPISLNSFDAALYKTLSNEWAQSMAVYGDYVIFFSNETNKAQLYNIKTGSLLATLDIPNGGYRQPHCNVACVGIETAGASSIMPVVYLSQWDAGYERACFVLDVSYSNGDYALTIVQKLNFASVSASFIGVGECDFMIDRGNNKIYAVAYKQSVYTDYGLATMVCEFNLPLLSAGSEVILTDSDIIDSFETDLIKYRQDAFMRAGRIFQSYGGLDNVKAGIAVIDIKQKKVVTNVPIYQYIDGEPECMDVYNGNKILFNYGTNLYELIV